MNAFKNKCPHCTFCANNKAVENLHDDILPWLHLCILQNTLSGQTLLGYIEKLGNWEYGKF